VTVKLQRLWTAPGEPMEVNGRPVYTVLEVRHSDGGES
jgi:hypothetical protein